MPKLGVAAQRICPVHTGVAVTTPVPDEAASALLRVVANTESTVWGREVPGKRMLMGAGAEYYYDNGLYDSRHRDLLRALRRSMTSEYPDLANYAYEFTWSGPLGMTGDQEPVIGAEGRDDNILYCGGYTALGLAMGTRAGQWLAGMLEGVEPPDWLFRETFRFPGEPL
ncbi:MAG: FAD-binding oxidoreductase, partial [bacterium]|nr:FAD-binding oxidoreductase [bacterium]